MISVEEATREGYDRETALAFQLVERKLEQSTLELAHVKGERELLCKLVMKLLDLSLFLGFTLIAIVVGTGAYLLRVPRIYCALISLALGGIWVISYGVVTSRAHRALHGD